jgi:CheY-like chemotaxis protein
MTKHSPEQVLVIDDDCDLRDILRLVLAEAGYAVETAENGQDALEAIARHKPDLILLDMRMPVMDGRAFARELRVRFAERPPIVVITASERAQANAAEVGAVGWLGKPFSVKDVLETVPRYL